MKRPPSSSPECYMGVPECQGRTCHNNWNPQEPRAGISGAKIQTL